MSWWTNDIKSYMIATKTKAPSNFLSGGKGDCVTTLPAKTDRQAI